MSCEESCEDYFRVGSLVLYCHGPFTRRGIITDVDYSRSRIWWDSGWDDGYDNATLVSWIWRTKKMIVEVF